MRTLSVPSFRLLAAACALPLTLSASEIFEPSVDLGQLPGGIRDLAAADVDLDGSTDLLALGSSPAVVGARLFLNNGSGTFATQQDLITSPLTVPQRVFLEDLDGDWYADAIYTTSTDIYVSRNQRGQGFEPEIKVIDEDFRIEHLRIIDFDKDGDLDLVWVRGLVGPVLLSLNQGDYQFANPITVLNGDYRATDLADLDGDGHLDMVAVEESNTATRHITIVWGDPANASLPLTPTVFLPFANAFNFGHQLILDDLGGDGFPDITMTSGATEGKTIYFQGRGADRAFEDPENVDRIIKLSYARADVTGDGLPDVLTESLQGRADLMLQRNLDGLMREEFEALDEVGSGRTAGTHVADIDGDGHLDVIYAQQGQDAVRFARGTGERVPGSHQARESHPGIPTTTGAKLPAAMRFKATAADGLVYYAGKEVWIANTGASGFRPLPCTTPLLVTSPRSPLATWTMTTP